MDAVVFTEVKKIQETMGLQTINDNFGMSIENLLLNFDGYTTVKAGQQLNTNLLERLTVPSYTPQAGFGKLVDYPNRKVYYVEKSGNAYYFHQFDVDTKVERISPAIYMKDAGTACTVKAAELVNGKIYIAALVNADDTQNFIITIDPTNWTTTSVTINNAWKWTNTPTGVRMFIDSGNNRVFTVLYNTVGTANKFVIINTTNGNVTDTAYTDTTNVPIKGTNYYYNSAENKFYVAGVYGTGASAKFRLNTYNVGGSMWETAKDSAASGANPWNLAAALTGNGNMTWGTAPTSVNLAYCSSYVACFTWFMYLTYSGQYWYGTLLSTLDFNAANSPVTLTTLHTQTSNTYAYSEGNVMNLFFHVTSLGGNNYMIYQPIYYVYNGSIQDQLSPRMGLAEVSFVGTTIILGNNFGSESQPNCYLNASSMLTADYTYNMSGSNKYSYLPRIFDYTAYLPVFWDSTNLWAWYYDDANWAINQYDSSMQANWNGFYRVYKSSKSNVGWGLELNGEVMMVLHLANSANGGYSYDFSFKVKDSGGNWGPTITQRVPVGNYGQKVTILKAKYGLKLNIYNVTNSGTYCRVYATYGVK